MLTIKNWAAKYCLFLLTVAVVLAGCKPQGSKALLEGKKLIDEGRYSEAVAQLETATSIISTNAGAWNYLGLAYHHSGDARNAEQAYLKALALDRNLVEVHYNLGTLRLEEGRLDSAKSALTSYTAFRGNVAEGWLKLATAQYRLRELAAAEKSFEQALRLDRENPEALNGLGLIQLQRRDPRKAAVFFNRALSSKPDYAPALLNLAVVNHTSLNNPSMALRIYREYLALPVRPENWEAVNATVIALNGELNPSPSPPTPVPNAQTNLTEKPRAAVASIRSNAPAQTPAYGARSPVHPASRTVVPTRAGSQTPTPAPAPRTSPEPLQAVKVEPEQQIRAADPSVPTRSPTPTPGSPSAPVTSKAAKKNKDGFLKRINPANLFREKPASQSAAVDTPGSKAFPRYKYRNPPKPAAGDASAAEKEFLQGAAAQRSQRYADAIQAYKEAIRKDPSYFDAHYNMAVALTVSGSLSQALTAYESALAIRPDSLDARYNFALVLKQANYVFDSARELENLLAKYPREARAHVILGNLYDQQLRQPAKAKDHYVKALELDPRNPQADAIRFWLNSH